MTFDQWTVKTHQYSSSWKAKQNNLQGDPLLILFLHGRCHFTGVLAPLRIEIKAACETVFGEKSLLGLRVEPLRELSLEENGCGSPGSVGPPGWGLGSFPWDGVGN